MCLQRPKVSSRHNMEDLKKRLTRSLSVPRRCSKCQKTVYFFVVKCRECGDVIHKHCSHHKHSHRVVLTDNTTAQNICNFDAESLSTSEHNKDCQHQTMSESSCDFSDPSQRAIPNDSPGVAMAGLLKIVRWLSHRRKTKEFGCKAMAVEKHVKGRFGLNPKLDDKETRKKLKAFLKNTQNYHQKQIHGQPQQLQFQRQRCSSARSASSSSTRSQRRLCRSFAIRSDSTVPSSPLSSVSSCTEYSSPFGTPKLRQEDSFIHQACHYKEQTLARKPVFHIADQQKSFYPKNGGVVFPGDKEQIIERTENKPLPELMGWTFGTRLHTAETENEPEHSFHSKTATLKFAKPPTIAKAKTLSIESKDFNNDSLCATWPPVGKAGAIIEEVSEEVDYDLEDEEEEENSSLKNERPRPEEALKEWCIPFGDIEFRERIRHGRNGDIYRGRWYGEVLIYTIRNSCESELSQFLEDVSQMGMIRHENIVLFMGACIEPPRLAVITSMRKGPTLYEYLHLKRHRLPFHSKLNIARQIAQGMGYLHAKEIVHRKLNSKNIILESRVKLCMMDHSMSDKNCDRNDYGCVPRGHLSYVSPELMSTLQIQPPGIHPTAAYTQQSDTFAFGSLLFELLAERFAFHEQHPHAIIYQVATGKRCSLENFRFINGLKSLIKKCWWQNPVNRPPFSEIVTVLQENVTHHKRHSSSVPDKLHYTGQCMRRNICT